MANMLSTGAEYLSNQRETHMSVTVTYERDAISGTPSAMRGHSNLIIKGKDGAATKIRTDDFIITQASLPAGITEPAKNDRITVGGVTYTVQNVPQHGAWRWATGQHVSMRIHTQRSTVAA